MKRTIALILMAVLLLSLASCGKKGPEPTVALTTEPATEPTTAPTTEPTIPAPTEPEWEPGVSRANYGEVLYTVLEKGTEVNVLGQFGDYYVIEGEEVDLLIENRFGRLDNDDSYEEWTGYAKRGTGVFDNVYLRGEAFLTLTGSQKVQVLEGKGDWLYIRVDDQEGYVDASLINKNRGGGGSGGGSGGGGGPVDGTGFDFGSLAFTDDSWHVTLLGAYFGPEMDNVETTGEEENFAPGKGKILAGEVEAYIALTLRDDELKITEKTEETVTVWLADEFYGTLPRWLVRMEGDESYESWTGYCKRKSVIYEEYQMRNELQSPKVNTKVTVLDELPDCYVVELEDGAIGYMKLDDVSETKISAGGGGGSSGGGGGGSVWTPPAL